MDQNNQQKSIEHYFQEHNITNPDQKAKLLLLISELIYERNNQIVLAEKEQDPDLQIGHIKEAEDTEAKIKEIITDFLEGK